MYFKLQVTIATELLVDAARYNLSQKWTKPPLTLFTKTMDYYFNRAIVYLRPKNVSNERTIQFNYLDLALKMCWLHQEICLFLPSSKSRYHSNSHHPLAALQHVMF